MTHYKTNHYHKSENSHEKKNIMEKSSRNTLPPKPMCLFCGENIYLMNTSFGMKIVTPSIRDGFNDYKLHIAKPNMKRADNASVKMAP
jgi:hypothetical protein